MEKKPTFSQDDLVVNRSIAKPNQTDDLITSIGRNRAHVLARPRYGTVHQDISHIGVPILAEPISSDSSAETDDDRQKKRLGTNFLFVGFEAADEGDLSSIYSDAAGGLAFSKGAADDLLILSTRLFDALAIHVDLCELYAPLIVRFLQQKEALTHDADVVAVATYLIPNFVEQLKSSGFTNVISASKDLTMIFPRRVRHIDSHRRTALDF